jgi:menaquinone-dependent protoporphyrinogen oxidase
MKTLIIYATTYGFTGECVEELKGELKGEVTAVNVMTETVPDLKEYDNIIMGGSIYMGQIHKNLKDYCTVNSQLLSKKTVALFLCCGLAENFDVTLATAFPEDLIKVAIAKECFGGELRIKKMKFIHKMITGMMKKATAKDGKPEPKKLPENIHKLAQTINNR